MSEENQKAGQLTNIYDLRESYRGGSSSYTNQMIFPEEIHPADRCLSCCYYSPWKNGEVLGAFTRGQKLIFFLISDNIKKIQKKAFLHHFF